ncbi:SDR family NAD(P)-dependent oxidoreductase [Streptomyces sp. NPDC058701]|uniref:SDR family NAD(P)-dependent oxidoreductase n=1 Tax=Streptomyces sp. NPDC058701 TaxID=3346608 RepID=UPI0036547F94
MDVRDAPPARGPDTAGSPLAGARVLVVGATGVLGGLAARELAERGAVLALAGRAPHVLAERGAELGGRPVRRIDAYDLDGCAALAPWARGELGGLDGVLVTVGVAAFGRAGELPDSVAEHLCAVNFLCPAAVLRGAPSQVARGGFLAAVTGAVVDTPLQGMADYAAAKAALGCWLGVLAREVRGRHLRVLDFRPPHLDTGFATRPVAGRAPSLPPGGDPYEAARSMVDRLEGVA